MSSVNDGNDQTSLGVSSRFFAGVQCHQSNHVWNVLENEPVRVKWQEMWHVHTHPRNLFVMGGILSPGREWDLQGSLAVI